MKKTILSVFSFLLLLGNGYPVYASHNYLPDGNNPEVDNNLKKQKLYKESLQIQMENLLSVLQLLKRNNERYNF